MNAFWVLGGACLIVAVGAFVACSSNSGAQGSTAYRRGYKDHVDGTHVNPYAEDTPEYRDWLDGQIAAFGDSCHLV